jgi:hypothetical protein
VKPGAVSAERKAMMHFNPAPLPGHSKRDRRRIRAFAMKGHVAGKTQDQRAEPEICTGLRSAAPRLAALAH